MTDAQAAFGMATHDPNRLAVPGQNDSYAARSSVPSPPRTPSPTPEDLEELDKPVIDFKRLLNPKTYMKKKYIPYFIFIVIAIGLSVVLVIKHDAIVTGLTPISTKLLDIPAGFLIPIAILFVISFPPLFGHEIIAILVGVVWGLWIGFAIVAAGTFLGEVGNFYAFKYCCASRGRKLERDNISYACLAHTVRHEGFLFVLVARLSAIPGHFTTAVFSTCGMSIWIFSIAAILSLPKQLITVYFGVIFKQSAGGNESTRQKIISDSVLAVSLILTFVAAYYIYWKMRQAKPHVLTERRRAKARKDWQLGMSRLGVDGSTDILTAPENNRRVSNASSMYNPSESEEGYAGYDTRTQKWDAYGRPLEQPFRQDSGEPAGWDTSRTAPVAPAPRMGYPPVQMDAFEDSAENPYGGPQRTTSPTTAPAHMYNAPPQITYAPPPAIPPPPSSAPLRSQASANMPRYQLQDGPQAGGAPSVMTQVPPSYHTYEPNGTPI